MGHFRGSLHKSSKKCFLENCFERSIGSHSLSESRTLKLLEGKDDKNKIVLFYLGDEIIGDRKEKKMTEYNSFYQKLKSIPKSQASVFYGFCLNHDGKIFESIDKEKYSNTEKINFLHSFRCYSYYISKWIDLIDYYKEFLFPALSKINEIKKDTNEMLSKFLNEKENLIPDNFRFTKEMLEELNNDIEEIVDNDITNDRIFLKKYLVDSISNTDGIGTKELLRQSIEKLNSANELESKSNILNTGIDIRLSELEKIKDDLEKIYIERNYTELNYLSLYLNDVFLIAGSFVYQDNNSNTIALTILPEYETKKTYIIFGSLSKETQILFSSIKIKSEEDLKIYITETILKHGSNIFVSPEYWRKLPDAEQNYWLTERNKRIITNELNLFRNVS